MHRYPVLIIDGGADLVQRLARSFARAGAQVCHAHEGRTGLCALGDGVDLWLDQAACGNLFFESRLGSCAVALEQLQGAANRRVFDLGGLGLGICVERCQERLVDLSAAIDCEVHPPADRMTPYLVKAVQSDGHLAWSSPIFIV